MSSIFPDSANFSEKLNNDGEFKIAARYWNGGFNFKAGDSQLAIKLTNGVASADDIEGDLVVLEGAEELWIPLLKANPERNWNDLLPVVAFMGMELKSDPIFLAQYFPAIARIVELLRPENSDQKQTVQPERKHGDIDAVVGRYVNLEMEGDIYRVYYEEAGEGIPVILQHTAGAHGTQWRHILENKDLTSKFRFIAPDLPFHGKSVPPSSRKWWAEEYKLKASFLRNFIVTISEALNLDNPVYMGCSVGGFLALDLAYHNPDDFRAVIAVEGALRTEQDMNDFIHQSWYHPQVSNETKGRMMHGATAPTAPEAFRRETIQTYMAGWPAVFIGDLHYYVEDYDLTGKASEIDTNKIPVYILNGEFDYDGSWERGEQAHKEITGSKWTRMNGLGHFPMSEDPDKFLEYIKPVLDEIAAKG